MEEFTKVLEMKRQLSTVYYSQTDGQTGRINQEIETFLQYYMNYQQDNWIDWLAIAEFQYNDKKHVATRRILFELNFERHLWKDNLVVQMEVSRVEEFFIGIQKSWKQATKAIEEAQKRMKKQFNKKRQNPQGLRVRNNMWLENKNIHAN